MFSVIFQVQPKQERFDEYLSLAGKLKPLLEAVDGFVDNERFRSMHRPGWLLSHSTWRDEKSVVRWRTDGQHHSVQERGRSEIFRDYHLRVGEVAFDSQPPAGIAVEASRSDQTEVGPAKCVSLLEFTGAAGANPADLEALLARMACPLPEHDAVGIELFSSINNEGKQALLISWRSEELSARWTPSSSALKSFRHRRVRVLRDYGLFDRREAPQYFPPASAPRPGPQAAVD
jgi:heme-degrading monooxygenase HmoA